MSLSCSALVIFLSIALSNKMQKNDNGLLSLILQTANAVEPDLKLSVFCWCRCPRCMSKEAKSCQVVPSFPIMSFDSPALDSVNHCLRRRY